MQTTTWHFGRLGAAVGYRPFLFLLFSIIVLLPGFYGIIFKRQIHLNIDEGFTRLDAPSRREVQNQKAFFGANETAVPWYLAIFGVPRFENGSMLEDDQFAELSEIHSKVATKLTIPGPNGTKLTYQDICAPFCGINQMLVQALTAPSFLVDRGYPNFKILAFDVNVGKFIFERSFDKDGSLAGSKLMVFYFTVFVDSAERKNQLDELDKQAIEVVKTHNSNPNRTVDIVLHGNYPVQLEVQRGFEESMPLVFYGILAGLFVQIGRDFLTFFFVSILSLGITAYLAIPYYQMAFAFFASTIFYMSFLQLFFFCPTILLTCRYSPETVHDSPNSNQPRKVSCLRKIKKFFSTRIVLPYSTFLQKPFGKLLFVSVFCVGFLWPATYGVKNLQNQMDLRRILPGNSTALRAFGFMDQHVWNDFLQYIFVMNNPPKFDDPEEFGQFKKMLTELETLPQTFGTKSNMMWLYDYFNFELGQDFHKADVKAVNMSKFRSFITTTPYDAWNDGVKWSVDPTTNETTIESMIFMITFKNVTSLQGKVDTLSSCREVLSKYPQFDVASFDTDSATVDTILSVPPTLISSILTLIVLTAVVSSFMMQNLVAALATTFFTTSTVVGIFGFAHFAGIQVDALGVGAFVYSSMIGLLMTCQAVSTYFRHAKTPNRLPMTLERLGCQACKLLLLAGAITIPVLFSTVPVHLFNIRVVILSVIISVVHIFFFIPTTLNFFPAPCTGNACFYDSE
uniref:SSD domain-containing protein n=1 Tax=Panagrolaimus sp. JU765 TaxID=591449 RepID=A0AC34QNY4_9BILA